MKHISSLLASLLAALLIEGCTAARILTFNVPTIRDSKLFPAATLPASDAPFEPLRRDYYCVCPAIDSLLEDLYTTGIIVARGDSIIYCRFKGGYSANKNTDLFSLSKSFVGALTGIALAEGHITSIDDPVVKYLPECAQFLSDSTRVCDLLNMRGGIYETHWCTAQMYYTRNLSRTTIRSIRQHPHGEYSYANISTQLLAGLIEQATGQTLTDYFVENYWLPSATSHEGQWTFDSHKHLSVRAFCGLSITPIDVVKLGMIYRDGGALGGRQIVPAEWVSHILNPPYTSNDRGGATYHCQWYIINPDTEFLGQGFMGQILYVNRATDTVVARFGVRRGKTDWTRTMQQIATLPDQHFW